MTPCTWFRARLFEAVPSCVASERHPAPGLTPGLRFNITTLWLTQIWVLPTLVLAAVVGYQEYRRGHPQAKLSAAAFFLSTCLFDLAVDQDWVRGPRMLPVGMTVMIFSMAACSQTA